MTRTARDEGFESVYLELFPRAATAAYRLLGDAAAEDIASEALARAYARWPRLRCQPYRDGWILRVATNLAIDTVRRRRPALTMSDEIDLADAVTLRLALVAALGALPRRQRDAVALRYLNGLSEAQVAQSLGVSTNTASTHVRRGLKAMRHQRVERVPEEMQFDGT